MSLPLVHQIRPLPVSSLSPWGHWSTWHGPRAATASLFGSSAGAEGAAVERPAVTPQLPLHLQSEGGTLQDGTGRDGDSQLVRPSLLLVKYPSRKK